MEKTVTIFCLLFLTFLPCFGQSQFTFISPVSGSKFHPVNTSVILRSEQNQGNFSPDFVKIKGEISGAHPYKFSLSADKKTIIIQPEIPFNLMEKVTVEILQANRNSEPFSFHFYTSAWDQKTTINKLTDYYRSVDYLQSQSTSPLNKNNFQDLKVDINNSPEKGFIFVRNSGATKPDNRFTQILDNTANPVFSLQDSSRGYCFQQQENGTISYFNRDNNGWEILDSSLKVIDTVFFANGYKADLHDFVITPDGHYFLMAYDPQSFDMRKIVANGDSNATVIGFIIQELDENKKLIFQWRSWDYFNIKDALHLDLTKKNIDYVHGNSLKTDKDGHIIISSRHLDEITKINRTTGDIIWRLGGVNNQFRFIGDSPGFCYQHDAKRLANGNLLLFDNGNFHPLQISAAKEYILNEDSMTATLVWKYAHPDSIYARAMGNAQRLPGGSTWINWGLVRAGDPAITEVDPDGKITWQAHFENNDNAYRSYRYNFQLKTSEIQKTGTIKFQNPVLIPNPATNYFLISGNFTGAVKITGITGKTFKQFNNYTSGSEIDISGLPAGIYCISMNDKMGTLSYAKLIKY